MQDAWRAYLEVALGLTEASRRRAQEAVRKLVGTSGATAAQLQGLAEELMSTGVANREALTKLVRFEVDRALGVVGLATADEVAELTGRVRHLERELREARGTAPGAAAEPPIVGASADRLARKAIAKKAVPVRKASVETAPGAKKLAPKKLPPVAKKAAPKKAAEQPPSGPGTGAA